MGLHTEMLILLSTIQKLFFNTKLSQMQCITVYGMVLVGTDNYDTNIIFQHKIIMMPNWISKRWLISKKLININCFVMQCNIRSAGKKLIIKICINSQESSQTDSVRLYNMHIVSYKSIGKCCIICHPSACSES